MEPRSECVETVRLLTEECSFECDELFEKTGASGLIFSSSRSIAPEFEPFVVGPGRNESMPSAEKILDRTMLLVGVKTRILMVSK